MLQNFEMTLMLVKCGPKKNIFPVPMKAKSAGGVFKETYLMLKNLSCDPSS